MRKKVIMHSDANHRYTQIEEMKYIKQKVITMYLVKNNRLKLNRNANNVMQHLNALVNPKGDHIIHPTGYFKT